MVSSETPNARTSTGTADTERLFTGQRFDAATGLYYYNARYYDPTIGSFGRHVTLVGPVRSKTTPAIGRRL